MKVTLLGTGTSTGVPQVGCNCRTCTSKDPRDKRLRCSALVEIDDDKAVDGTTRILIDCSPDFRYQVLRDGFKRLDAVVVTHEHYDHVGGIDDLRPYSVYGNLTVHADPFCAKHLMERIPYCFTPKDKRYPGVPAIDLEPVEPGTKIKVNSIEILTLKVMHGKLPIMAYRIGPLGYVTDMKTIEPDQKTLLEGITHLVVNGLRHQAHPTHQTIEEAIEFADSLNVKEAYIIHTNHHIAPHAEEMRNFPQHRHLAYDQMTFFL